MLALAGVEFFTFAGGAILVGLSSPTTAPSIEIGVFDGNTSGPFWDDLSMSSLTTDLEFTLFSDPNQTGNSTGLNQLEQWLGSTEPDNAWSSHMVVNTPGAQGAGNNFFYLLVIRYTDPNDAAISAFKLRTDGTILLSAQTLSFIGALFNPADLFVVYPNFPSLTPTTYDGNWQLNLLVPPGSDRVELWDGDLDFGKFDGDPAEQDTDDPNSSGVPPFASPVGTNPEGVAIGALPGVTGNPPDDNFFTAFRRSPSVVYDLIAPNGDLYTNSNPSGSQEWEFFSVGTTSVPNRDLTAIGNIVPSGIWRMTVRGVDMGNLNAFSFLNAIAGVCEDGTVCNPPPPPPPPPECRITPDLVKGKARCVTSFLVSVVGATTSSVVSARPFFNNACFSLFPTPGAQVVIPPGGAAQFQLNARMCPVNASQFASNSQLVIQTNTCGTKIVQVEWAQPCR